jgi:hypothetical protein
MIIGAQIDFASFFLSLLGMFPSDAGSALPIAAEAFDDLGAARDSD